MKRGERPGYEPLAVRLFAEGNSIQQIVAIFKMRGVDISHVTLYRWKNESKQPSRNYDEWERARAQRNSGCQRIRDLLDREINAAELTSAGRMNGNTVDAMSKLLAMAQRWQQIEKEDADKNTPKIDRPALFLENLQWIAGKLREHDPQGLKILAKNFDILTMNYKLEFGG